MSGLFMGRGGRWGAFLYCCWRLEEREGIIGGIDFNIAMTESGLREEISSGMYE